MDKIAKLLSRSCPIDDLKYVLISFSFDKLRSPLATVMGMGSRVLRAMLKFGNSADPMDVTV